MYEQYVVSIKRVKLCKSASHVIFLLCFNWMSNSAVHIVVEMSTPCSMAMCRMQDGSPTSDSGGRSILLVDTARPVGSPPGPSWPDTKTEQG